ncbi:MAG: hypothetical protein IKD84_05040 [Erysipelotrichaceae bacterium]|nr:hypothetical protein [Erysipelotrichaceae bacterium]MBR3351759.1 hypothetical protein [Erysipelotrichaceae bacterium]
MEIINAISQFLYNLGPVLMVPLVMFILSLVFGMGFKKSLRVGITVGVGLTGVYLILDFFIAAIGGAANILGEKYGGALTFVDIGWSSFSAIGWASKLGLIFIPVGIISNLIMLALNWTNHLSVNIWDYWEAIVGGMITQLLSGSFLLGLVAATACHMINIKVGDWTADQMQDFFGFPGIVSYAPGYAEWGLIGKPIAWLMDHIPGLNKIHLTPEEMSEKVGIFGEPIFIGFFIGTVMGLIAGMDVVTSLTTGINLAAAMYIQPKMIGILMEGLIPVSDGAKEFLQKHAPNRKLFIGLDPAIGTGNPTALAVAALMVPTAIVLALFLPGSKVMPLADLTFIVFFSMWAAAVNKGDVLKSYLTTVIITIFAIYSNAYTAPIMNRLAADSGLISDTSTLVTHFANGYYTHIPFCTVLGQLFGGGNVNIDGTTVSLITGIILCVILLAGFALCFLMSKNKKKEG